MAQNDFVDEFFAEAREQLLTAEEDVLALEQSGEHPDAETVNRLFRALHSIKGGAACVDLNGIKELAHAMENVVGLVREGSAAPTRAVTQLLLDGLDRLKTCIASADERLLTDTGTVIEGLTGVVNEIRTQGNAPKPEKDGTAEHYFDLKRCDLSVVRAQSLHLYEFALDIVLECKKSNCTPAELYQKICSVGTIIADYNEPVKDPARTMPCFFLLATVIDDPEILFPGLEVIPVSFYRYTPEEIPSANGGDRVARAETGAAEIKKPLPENKTTAVKSTSGKNRPAPKLLTDDDSRPAASVAVPVDEQAVRIPVELLDKLMNLVGELVVVRNRNTQLIIAGNTQELSVVNQRLNTVTMEIQMTVMRTRMRPVGNVFSRFTRVVRDLSRTLGKEIELDISGGDVELDKSIVDNIAEPLTHLVRNAADHGLEAAEDRLLAGKPAVGHISLSARHQAGMVNIRIDDDGKGIDPHLLRSAAIEKGLCTLSAATAMTDREAFELILLPGFSTASEVTDLSGRGVGMDVVKTSFQKFGGIIEIQSAAGAGTTISINLPLTLAIIPALILTVEGQCFAIPQVNVNEVVWLHGDEVYQSIHEIDDKEVYWLRGKMLPLMRLSKVLEIRPTYRDPETNERKMDRRKQAPDRRQKQGNVNHDKRKGPRDRRTSILNSLYIIVLQVGSDQFGLCVETIVDTEEIVVKPLHEHLEKCRVYAGITVLGDGSTALIIDVPELARTGGVRCDTTDTKTVKSRSSDDDRQKMLVFSAGGKERFALPLSLLLRVDEVSVNELQTSGGREYLRFGNSVVPLVRLEKVINNISICGDSPYLFTIIPRIGKPIGVAAAEIIDIVDTENSIEPGPVGQNIIIGTQLVDGHLTGILDLCALVDAVEPGWYSSEDRNKIKQRRVVLVEDSSFFSALLGSYLRGIGVLVTVAVNGREALEIVEHTPVDGVISDLEMPVMDGFELARHLRSSENHRSLPLMGISAMDETVARPRALDAGFDAFCSKGNLPRIISCFETILTKAKMR
ncbi:MAG: chemotaxis protein CheW [Chitinispirillaceae bacterium]|nr:chemotaxis protein CheW [Chitinispirillaceae bacterium]